MILLTVAAMLAAADLNATKQRDALSACLKEANFKAKDGKVAGDGFDAFARTHCATYEADLRKAVIALDVKNGISRKDANENATFELNDYFLSATERYQAEMPRSPVTAPVTQASAPAQPPQPAQP